MNDKPRLVHSDPPPEMEQAVLRLRADAAYLVEHMNGAQVRSVDLILEQVRDNLSKVLARCEGFKS